MLPAFRYCLLAATTLLLAQPALAGGRQPVAKPAAPAKARPAVPVVALPAPASPEAARPVVLTGVVLRADGQPCPGAAVYLAGTPRNLVVTDAQGAFRLPGVPAGRPVTVLADYFGLGNTRLVLASPASQPLRLTLGQ